MTTLSSGLKQSIDTAVVWLTRHAPVFNSRGVFTRLDMKPHPRGTMAAAIYDYINSQYTIIRFRPPGHNNKRNSRYVWTVKK